MKKYQLLLDLINAFGVSGKEMDVRDLLFREIKKYISDVHVDKLGNLIAHKKGKSPRMMFASHMDEVGLIVKNIEKDGKIRISKIGGVDPFTLLNEKVIIKTRKALVKGVITTETISSSLENIESKFHFNDLFIDAGLSKKELEKFAVHIGSFISFSPNAEIIGNGKIISGKALDDRIGCYILVELIKLLKDVKNEIFFVFTVQEEVGLYGAKTSTYTIDPDWAIAVDVTDCDDWMINNRKTLGNGPTLTIKDEEMISNPCLDDHILEIARKKRIPLQPDVSESGTTDAMNISISKGGVPSAVIGVPVRGLHTPISLAHLQDIDHAIQLLKELFYHPPTICTT